MKYYPKMSISALIHKKTGDFSRINAVYIAYNQIVVTAIF